VTSIGLEPEMSLSASDEECLSFARKLDLCDERYREAGIWLELTEKQNASSFIVCLVCKLLCSDPSYLESLSGLPDALISFSDMVNFVLVHSNIRITARKSVRIISSVSSIDEEISDILQIILFVTSFFEFDPKNDSVRTVFLEWSASRGQFNDSVSQREKDIMRALSAVKESFMPSSLASCLASSLSLTSHFSFSQVFASTVFYGRADIVIEKHVLPQIESLQLETNNLQLTFLWIFLVKWIVTHAAHISPHILAALISRISALVSLPNPTGALALEVTGLLHAELNSPGHFLRCLHSRVPVLHVLLENSSSAIDQHIRTLAALLDAPERSTDFFDSSSPRAPTTDVARLLLLRSFVVRMPPSRSTPTAPPSPTLTLGVLRP
jgi:hypothetical protein